MLDDLFGGGKIFILVLIILLLFGATRLPALARSLAQSRNAFKTELDKGKATSTDATGSGSDEATPTAPKP